MLLIRHCLAAYGGEGGKMCFGYVLRLRRWRRPGGGGGGGGGIFFLLSFF